MDWTVENFDWDNHRPVDLAVLCFIRSGGNLLLIHKKRGLGNGKINAPGGRIEPGETALEAAVRETEEEVGLTPAGLSHAGELSFVFADGYSLSCSVFTAGRYTGTLRETEEAKPFWCSEGEIPFERMWADDRLWIPLMLSLTPFRGFFLFQDDAMSDWRICAGADAALGAEDLRGRKVSG